MYAVNVPKCMKRKIKDKVVSLTVLSNELMEIIEDVDEMQSRIENIKIACKNIIHNTGLYADFMEQMKHWK
jgi:hypothetical protein